MSEDEAEVERIRELIACIDRSDYEGAARMLDCDATGGDVLQGALHAAFIRSVRPLLRSLDAARSATTD